MSKKSPDGRGGVAEMKASLDKKPARPLTAADLCDRCSARAVVETVMMQGGSLLWCAHHFAFFQDALNAFGATILAVSYTHLRAHETDSYLVCRLLLEKKKITETSTHYLQ